MIAILGAMEREIGHIVSGVETAKSLSLMGRGFHAGSLAGGNVIVGYTGVGKVLAAMVTQSLVDRYRPDAICYFGIAGALNQKYEAGDVIVARDTIQHDMDATMFGFCRGEIPGEKIISLPCDAELVRIAAGWCPRNRKVYVGRVLTGDQFVSTSKSDTYAYLTAELKGDAVDMEGAAAALVAYFNEVPFLLVRIISDRADGILAPGFKTLVSEASTAFRELSEHLIRNRAS